MRMNVGEEFEFNGILLRVEREMSDFSCEGCFFKCNRLIAIAKAQDRESLLLW